MNHDDDHIKARAYQIWEDEGRPHGKHDEHWHQATQEHGGKAPTTSGSGSSSAAPTTTGSDLHPGMMGDGTEEQNLNQTGNPSARITESEVTEAFGSGKKP